MREEYNSLENIDVLIEKLEASIPTSEIDDVRVKNAISKRRRQINELKKLQQEARKQAAVEAELQRIESGNDEIDEVIGDIKQLLKVKKNEVNKRYNCNSSNSGGESSESRTSESNYCYRTSYTPSYSSYSSESRSSESRW